MAFTEIKTTQNSDGTLQLEICQNWLFMYKMKLDDGIWNMNSRTWRGQPFILPSAPAASPHRLWPRMWMDSLHCEFRKMPSMPVWLWLLFFDDGDEFVSLFWWCINKQKLLRGRFLLSYTFSYTFFLSCNCVSFHIFRLELWYHLKQKKPKT